MTHNEKSRLKQTSCQAHRLASRRRRKRTENENSRENEERDNYDTIFKGLCRVMIEGEMCIRAVNVNAVRGEVIFALSIASILQQV